MNKSIDQLIIQMLLFDGNESNLLDDIDSYTNFRRLIIELAKVKYDVRWCSNDKCQCHPETTIKNLINRNKELQDFLNRFNLLDDILYYIKNYEPTTVFDKGYTR
jgi:hypothetical protein